MKASIIAVLVMSSLCCSECHGDTNTVDPSGDPLGEFLSNTNNWPRYPPDEVLAELPRRMLNLRDGMSVLEAWEALGLADYRFGLPIDPTGYWRPEAVWEYLHIPSEKFDIEVKLPPRSHGRITGIRIRRKGAKVWVSCEFEDDVGASTH